MTVVYIDKYYMDVAKKVTKAASYNKKFCDVIEQMYPKSSIVFRQRVLRLCEDLYFWSKNDDKSN